MKKQTNTTPEVAGVKPTTEPQEHPFRAIRRAGVPIVAYETADPAQTIKACRKALNGKIVPCMQWDCIEGLRPIKTGTKEVDEAAATMASEIGDPQATQNFPSCMSLIAAKPPQGAVIFVHAGNRVLEDWTAGQSIWNLRDILKGIKTTLVLLGPSVKLPPELSADAPIFEEPVPTQADIEREIDDISESAAQAYSGFQTPAGDERARVIDSLTGYASQFAVEQSLSLALSKDGFNIKRLWELKVSSLKNTAGLEISQPSLKFDDMAGAYGIKDFFTQLLNARQRTRGVFWLEEIEKMLAGGGGDLSGTSQAMIEQFLFWTEAKKVLGLLFIGVPGAGKSFAAQAFAGEAQIPLLRGSMSSVKGSLVGQSEANMKSMLRAVDSITQGQTLMIATCNSLDSLTPEIMARFKLGIVAFDFPTLEESNALWRLYIKKYDLPTCELPEALIKNWVPREIESCCHRAWLFNCSLEKAAQSVVPVCKANKEKMDTLRRSMSGRFMSAAKPGIYQYEELNKAEPKPAGRRFE